VLTALRTDGGSIAGPFDHAFSSIDFSSGTLVAVSGGSDSTALLLLVKDYLDRNAPMARLVCVTIDHDMRSGSAAEARAVARLCADRGIEHRTILWSGDKPTTGLPASAREARYRLLAQAAQDAGIDKILTGHTADDQAETVLMRQMRTQQHGRGLAGMAPATLYGWKTWVLRPLLGARRAALRDYLRSQGVGWAEDPTNSDKTFERPRIRASLNERQFAESIAHALHTATQRETTSHCAAALIRSFASQPAPGLVRLDPAFAADDQSAAILATRILLATMGGVSFPPDEARTAALVDRFSGPAFCATPFCATLSRTVIDSRRAGIFLRRELRDLPDATPAHDGMIWDGRRQFGVLATNPALTVEAQGPNAVFDAPEPSHQTPASPVRAANAAEPQFQHVLSTSSLSPKHPQQVAVMPVVAPFARFLPSFDLDLAVAVSALIGAPPLPAPPITGKS
jgi:tRNA(Ile)-lysidine synthase